MATGMVVGLTRYRDTWTSAAEGINDNRGSLSPGERSLTMTNPSSHHRSYSDAHDSLNRLRLPPISDLIEDAGRPDSSHRPAYNVAQRGPQFQSGPVQLRSPGRSESSPWSPSSDPRSSYLQERPSQYEQRLPTEQYYYHRAGDALPQLSGSDGTHRLTHVSPQSTSDPLNPHARATGKTVVREEMIPGKGLCYVYDDGTFCQKIINGDPVNPKWGTTKAGKPRKRLGQACNTCREKKIKCDPSYPKCTQCQKFGRECRFEAPYVTHMHYNPSVLTKALRSRPANKSPGSRLGGSPPATSTTEDNLRTRRPSVALTDISSHSESGTMSSRAAGTADENLSPLTNDSNFLSDVPGPSKKMRLTRADSETLPVHQHHTSLPGSHHIFSLEADPFKVNKRMTESYLSAYFTMVNNPALTLFPERLFLEWASGAEEKSQASKLVLYCMLALGSSLSKSPEKSAHGRIFESIALEGIMQSFGHFSIQLIQARVIFALYEFQHGQDDRAWDLCGAAMRTASAMGLNTEDGVARQVRTNNTVFGLDPVRLAECMRRTWWAVYTMDNLGVACLCITATFSKADCSLRLPCTRQAYESGIIPKCPVFDGEIQRAKTNEVDNYANIGALAHLMQISSLCCDVRTLAFRASHRVNSSRSKSFAAARDELDNQLNIWNENYLAHIDRKSSRKTGKSGEYKFSFGGLHLLYHYACMQLHRNIPHSQFSRNRISEHARMAYEHAQSTLAIAEQFTSRKSEDIWDYHFGVSSPITGYAIHYAIDIVSAAGINAKLLENQSPVLGLIMDSAPLVDRLADVWSSARIQQKQVSDRVKLVMNSARAGIAEGKVGFCMENSMIGSLSKEEDLVYGIDRMQYLSSFEWAELIKNPSDLNIVSSRGTRGTYSIWG